MQVGATMDLLRPLLADITTDGLSLVGEVVSSAQKPYQDRRTQRTMYRLEVRVRAGGQQSQ